MMCVAVFKDGMCMPGCGKYRTFTTSQEVDAFIDETVMSVPERDLYRVQIFTGTDISISQFLDYKNIPDSASWDARSAIREIDVYAHRESIDKDLQELSRRRAFKRMQITHRLNNMTRDQLDEAKRIISGEI